MLGINQMYNHFLYIIIIISIIEKKQRNNQ